MAENEILDVGSSKRYRRYKAALRDKGRSAADVAAILQEELLSSVRKSLRKAPIHVLLQACRKDKPALQEAIANLTELSFARFVENAFKITRSVEAIVIATKTVDLLVDAVLNRSDVHIARDEYRLNAVRQAEFQKETVARLNECKPELIRLVVSSLNGELVKPIRAKRQARPAAQTVVSMSLRG